MPKQSPMETFREQIVSEVLRHIESVIEKHLSTAVHAMFGSGSVLASGSSKAVKPRRKRAKAFCPVKGCKHPFAPRFGGYCVDHKDSVGYKAWKSGKAAPKGKAKAAKPVKKAVKKAAPKKAVKKAAPAKAKPKAKIAKAKTPTNGAPGGKESQADRNARLEV